jgi:hypothetical protein
MYSNKCQKLIIILVFLLGHTAFINAKRRRERKTSQKIVPAALQLKHPVSIKIFCTAALTAYDYAPRMRQYMRSLETLINYGFEPYIVESCSPQSPTFLDNYSKHVLYTKSNNPTHSKSGNEAHSMLIGLKHFNFDPEDMIIKLTGRYTLESDEFIRLVAKNLDADVIIRAWNDSDAYTGLFAMRAKYLMDFIYGLDIERMGKQPIAIEHAIGAYVTKMRQDGKKVIYLARVYDYLPICTVHRTALVMRGFCHVLENTNN